MEGDAESKGRDRDTSRVRGEDGSADRRPQGKKGRLVGIITLSDVLKYVVGQASIISGGIGESWEDEEDVDGSNGDRSEAGSGFPGFASFGVRGGASPPQSRECNGFATSSRPIPQQNPNPNQTDPADLTPRR